MSASESSPCGCAGDTKRAQHDAADGRDLWIVVLLIPSFAVIAGAAWFELAAAGGIAVLFLQSAYQVVRSKRRELWAVAQAAS